MTNYNNNQDITTIGVLHVEVPEVEALFDMVEENIFGSEEVYDLVANFKGRELDSITLSELSQFTKLFPATYEFTSAELLLMLGYIIDRIS